jgi:hypothetical protein
MSRDFEFEDGGRTFACTLEEGGGATVDTWWWFVVSGADKHRYAPFRAAKGDTQQSVRSRVVAYYDNLVLRRSQPAVRPWRRNPQAPADTASSASETPAAPAEAVAAAQAAEPMALAERPAQP